MHTLIILPGNSVKNRKWGEAVAEHYSEQFDETFMLIYDHWETGEETMEFSKEVKKIEKQVNDWPNSTDITIIAKSSGALLALLAIKQGVVAPVRCVFFGIPFDLASQTVFKNNWSSLQDFSIPTIAFHNDDDPVADYTFTKKTIEEKGSNNIKLITTHGNDHGYFDFPLYDPYL